MNNHQRKAKPNVVFLIADDHRFDGLGTYGNPVVRTPVLDRLAQEGVKFQSIYTMGGQTAALCVPSRACLLTGANMFRSLRSDHQVGLEETENPELWAIHPWLRTLPEVLRSEGYLTYGIGKWHNGKESYARSFSDGANIFFGGMGEHVGLPVHPFDPQGLYPEEAARRSEKFSTELFAESAIDFIRSCHEDQPFMLYVAFTAPHDPKTPPPDYVEMYPEDAIPLPPNFMNEHPFDNGELRVRDERLAALPREPGEIRRHIAEYYGMISHLDTQIGRILKALQDKGLDRNTLIVYTADHGLALGQHGLMGKQNVYEHSVHIPLILHGPQLPQGLKVNGLACQIDIFPTLCELTGCRIPNPIDGISLVPLMYGEVSAIRSHVFSGYKNYQRMVSDGKWKLIRYYRFQGEGSDRIQLFDLQSDPWETRNLAVDAACLPRLRELEEAMRLWQMSVKDPLLDGDQGSYSGGEQREAT